MKLKYNLRRNFNSKYASKYVQLNKGALGEPAIAFYQQCENGKGATTTLQSVAHSILTNMLHYNHFEANGILNIYPMHLISTEQIRTLLKHANAPMTYTSWLDIGAGDGRITSEFKPFATNMMTTETASSMAARLNKLGFTCYNGDLAAEEDTIEPQHKVASTSFDMVSLLNVLCRCPKPNTLLERVVAKLKANAKSKGWILIAVPLPFEAFYYKDGQQLVPKERLIRRRRVTLEDWEEDADRVMVTLEKKFQIEIQAFSRVPYISAEDMGMKPSVLDDLLVLGKITSCSSS